MAKLKNYNGHFCESDFEYAFITFLEKEGWNYLAGNKINRVTKNDVLIADDFKAFISSTNNEMCIRDSSNSDRCTEGGTCKRLCI